MSAASIYRDALGDGTFMRRYLSWNSPLETPIAYDFWTGMWLLSCAVGRSLVVQRPHAPVYLNLYAVLCSDAGVTRKSTAVRRAEEVYHAAALDSSYHTVTASVSPEQLFGHIADQSQRTGVGAAAICVSELITVMGRERYTMGIPGLLTDLYDCPSLRSRSRVGTGTATIRDAYVTLLAASTPSWLVRAINPDVIEGGFTSRTLFVVEERPKRRVAWPDSTDAGGIGVPELVADLAAIRSDITAQLAVTGVVLSDAARARFTAWYERRATGHGAFLSSFEAREDHHVLRLAALLCINERLFVVHPRHIDHATRIIAHVKGGAAALFGDATVTARLVGGVDRLRAALVEAGGAGINKTDLIYKVRGYIKGIELDYALNVMHELGMVDRFDVQGSRGAPRQVWRATNNMQRRDIVLQLNERVAQ